MKENNNNLRHKAQYKFGQIWTIDFIVGLMLFIVIILVAIGIIYRANEAQTDVGSVTEAARVSQILLSQGYPSSWNNQTVIIPGILEEGKVSRISKYKLEQFDAIGYGRAKTLFGISGEYLFYMSTTAGIYNSSKCIYGYELNATQNCQLNMSAIHATDINRIDRLVIMDNKTMMLTVIVWSGDE